MPVRIYDIAKKLGIESKLVLAKAKSLGITTAKVPSSSLDKITAEYLVDELVGEHPPVVAEPAAPSEPIIITAPATPEVPAAAEAKLTSPTPSVEPSAEPAPVPPEIPTLPKPSVPLPIETASSTAPPLEVETAPSTEPAVPPPPRVGDKVGFIKLPPKPLPKAPERGVAGKAPARVPSRPEPVRSRSDARVPGQTAGIQNGADAAAKAAPNRALGAKPASAEPEFVPPTEGQLITLKPPIIVRDLADVLKKKPFQLIADLMQLNVFANVNQAIDELVAQKLCAKHGFRFEVEKRERGAGLVHAPVKKVELNVDDKQEDLRPRPPVVTIMGHVDHGKTTLLDVIRKSDVAAGEAGGITQHIGAYTISVPHPERKGELQQITFLDTPGHAAFSSMRARGANVTDIVVLVVAANDGVMPQTLEALNHARAAKVPILVAVNKCDHPNANPMKVRQQLQERGLVPDIWGGDTIFVDLSALTKQGVDKLLEMLVLQADLLELKANPSRRAQGNVVESGLEPGGPTATLLVRKGTLRVGDTVVCGQYWGRVRALINEEGDRLKEAAPSVAVKLLGLSGVPEAGLEFNVVENEKVARSLSEDRSAEVKVQDKERRPKLTLENLFDTLASESSKVLKVVVKADTQGSVEAIVEAIKKIETTKVTLEIIHSAVGTITESDVVLASASKAIVIGFHTRIDNGVSELAKREGIQIKLYAIIYELIDEVKDSMAGLLDPLLKEVVMGSAEVRKIFALSKGGNVAGCAVTTGRLVRGKMRVMRRKGLIFEGVTQSMRRFQDEANEVRAGMECGIRLEGFDDFQPGDTIECYSVEKVAQKL